ncbi:MAG TPA: gliding motility-associated C-terminal domain-containing protein [Bacteroidales bacterium]|nr:gliding motility-associated C-terminal domain-containing protein [Bacteroidales bacterium]
MKKLFITCLLILTPLYMFATHNRAGQITFELISGYTYKVTVTTFTYTKSAADRQQLLVNWGDNTSSMVDRGENKVLLPNDYFHNKYITTHTFPGPGVYEILMQDPNRNYGINNIPNSVNVIFSIKTTLVISPEIGKNSSPELLNFPIDKAAVGHLFIHNPAAYDPDGDSLSYKMTVCTEQDGRPIADYQIPKSSDTIYVDPVVGDLVWFTPVDTGKYNVAINIEEWRYGVKIGNITRDMQINVYQTDNNPPVNPALPNRCVVAGDLVELQITTLDADNDSVHQMMTGGPFAITSSPATFQRVAKGRGFSTSNFKWQTNCDHIRKQPWQLTVKSEDFGPDIQLVDIDNFTIRVLAPPVQNVTTAATSNQITLNWNQSLCGNVAGYYIYRHEGSTGYTPDSCTTGVPSSTGYVKIAAIKNPSDTVYVDDNNGEGLVQGIDYCYIVTAWYPDGSESIASQETCNSLVPGFPSLMNVSVTGVSQTNGSIYVSWAKPRNFDVTQAPGPYVFEVYRSSTGNGNDFQLVGSIPTSDLLDTFFIDSPLNTTIFPYYYTVKMFNNTPGNRFEMRPGENETASSLYLDIQSDDNQITLNIRKKAPWINNQYVIYRSTDPALPYDSLSMVDRNVYVDQGLRNGVTYYYQAKSIGWRPIDSVIYRNSNMSHINSAAAVDVTPPCAPYLYVQSMCDSNAMNVLRWTNPNKSCSNDAVKYKIYYSSALDAAMDTIATVAPATDTIFEHHFTEGMSLAACYAVTAIDSFGNESARSTVICVDQCTLYSLPNVFTPNNDGINDVYTSINLNHVIEKVDMKIFNRYGQLVFETADPDINWEGTLKNTDTRLKSGVYYYICDVYEPRISGTEIRTLTGFIHLYADGNAQPVTK